MRQITGAPGDRYRPPGHDDYQEERSDSSRRQQAESDSELARRDPIALNFKTGIAQGYLSDLESGRRTGTPETMAKLAQALNVPAEWLS